MIKIKIKNFQSIENSEIVIDGLTTLTGQNNTGKSALIRAVHAMYTNDSVDGILRNGKDFLEVTIEKDQNIISWKKGKKYNEYNLNGKLFEKVGKEIPQEILDLGIRPIEISGKSFFPQIALQIIDQIFLLNLSGNLLAEAISDIQIVGRLNKAYKLSEQEKKQKKAEVQIREKDLLLQTEKYKKIAGIDNADSLVDISNKQFKQIDKLESELDHLLLLREQRDIIQKELNKFSSFNQERIFDRIDFNLLDETQKIYGYINFHVLYNNEYKDIKKQQRIILNYKEINVKTYFDTPSEYAIHYLKSLEHNIGLRINFKHLGKAYKALESFQPDVNLNSEDEKKLYWELKNNFELQKEINELKNKIKIISSEKISKMVSIIDLSEKDSDRMNRIIMTMDRICRFSEEMKIIKKEYHSLEEELNALDTKNILIEENLGKLVKYVSHCPTCNGKITKDSICKKDH